MVESWIKWCPVKKCIIDTRTPEELALAIAKERENDIEIGKLFKNKKFVSCTKYGNMTIRTIVC